MTNRLIATVGCDLRLQVRNGFYHAAAFVALCWILALSRISPEHLTLWMPKVFWLVEANADTAWVYLALAIIVQIFVLSRLLRRMNRRGAA